MASPRTKQQRNILNETAEDGEMAGPGGEPSSQENIERVSKRSVPLVIGVSLLELVTALGMSFIINQLHQRLKKEWIPAKE
jgi:hypothetical protein